MKDIKEEIKKIKESIFNDHIRELDKYTMFLNPDLQELLLLEIAEFIKNNRGILRNNPKEYYCKINEILKKLHKTQIVCNEL